MRWTASLLAVAAVLVAFEGCKKDDGGTPPPSSASGAAAVTSMVHIATPGGPVNVTVEVVSTPKAIEKGLMFREHLDADAGMLFLLGKEQDWPFWMHNTLIPLDMIFIRRDMTVAGVVAKAEPKTDSLRKVGEPSLYVLEVNGGYCAAHGVIANAKVWFEGVEGR